MDLTVLTLALHVSGGIENPFAFFYVFLQNDLHGFSRNLLSIFAVAAQTAD